MKNALPSEHAEQVTLVNWFRTTYPNVRIIAIPNGGFRDHNTAKKLKAEGVLPGVPDLFIPEWNLWVEMKRQKGGRLSAEQKDWIQYLDACNYAVIVGYGFEDAKEKLIVFARNKTATQ
tara:strand:+ start:7359 stop:7715 length:357 start_codon:yes stop_codon:yes gene_type:complete